MYYSIPSDERNFQSTIPEPNVLRKVHMGLHLILDATFVNSQTAKTF